MNGKLALLGILIVIVLAWAIGSVAALSAEQSGQPSAFIPLVAKESTFNGPPEAAPTMTPTGSATATRTATATVTATATRTPTATPDNIVIQIHKPAPGAPSDAQLEIEVAVTSDYELQNVVARVGDRETNLVYSEETQRLVGTLSLNGLQKGEHILEVTATDFQGDSATATRTFRYDNPPTLFIEAPTTDTVAHPDLAIRATCEDDYAEECLIEAYLGESKDLYNPPVILASGYRVISTTVTFSGSTSHILHFRVRDSAGQISERDRRFYVETSPNLTEVETIPAAIRDVNATHLLYWEYEGTTTSITIRDRASEAETVIWSETDGTRNPVEAHLTSQGAIFVVGSNVYEWRAGELIDLGEILPSDTLEVAGSYAIWNIQDTLLRRDLTTGENAVVSTDAGNNNNDVAANGDVVYWGGTYDIYRYRDGSSTALTDDEVNWNTYPQTDGINVVYRNHPSCCYGDAEYSIMLHTDEGETTLAEPRTREPYPGGDYQTNDGWVAFTRLGLSGNLQIWLRDPAGNETQVTHFNSSSRIDVLGTDGELTLLNSGARYLVTPGSDPVAIGAVGQAYQIEGEWFVAIGRSLFQVVQ